jgi:signal transduction histidine kinase
MGSEEPPATFWRRATLSALTVSLTGVAAATFTAHGLNHPSASASVLQIFQCFVAVGAALAFLLRWRMTGEAPVALVGIALMVGWLPQIPLMLLQSETTAGALVGYISVPGRVAVVAACLWFLWRATRTPPVDSTLRPLSSITLFSLAICAAVVPLDVARSYGVVPGVHRLGATAADAGLAVATLAVVLAVWTSARAIPRPVSTRLGVALTLLTLSYLLRAVGRWEWPHLWVASEALALMALVFMAAMAAAMLRFVLEFDGLRLLGLRLRADTAEAAVQHDYERMHELRATVAGVRNVAAALRDHGRELDVTHRRRLEEMVDAELARLERLLAADDTPGQPGPVALDDMIGPLVLCHREFGADIRWQPSGLQACARPDQSTEVLNILLTNARIHAAGAGVEVTAWKAGDFVHVGVRDHGPGLPRSLATRAFSGERPPMNTNGHGLGLYIAHRLATEQGGKVDLVETSPGEGTLVVLTLPGVPGHESGSSSEPMQFAG